MSEFASVAGLGEKLAVLLSQVPVVVSSFSHSSAVKMKSVRRDFAPLMRSQSDGDEFAALRKYLEFPTFKKRPERERTSCHSYVLLATPLAEGEFLIKCHSETSAPSAPT
jgi:hypothetical protein